MIICGCEEPLQENNALYSLNPDTGQIDLAALLDPAANRYVFVWTGDTRKGPYNLAPIVRTALEEAQLKATWVSVWAIPSDAAPNVQELIRARLEVMYHDRVLENWDVIVGSAISTAKKPLNVNTDLTELTGFAPSHFRGVGWKRLLLIVGDNVGIDYILEPRARPVIEKFAFTGIVAPDQNFVSWLVENGLSIIYPARELTDCPALACLGPHVLPVDQLIEKNMIERAYFGSMATRAWKTRCV